MNQIYKIKMAISMLVVFMAVQARAEENHIDEIRNVCGLSDTVLDYIRTTMKEKSTQQYSLSALIGTGRRLITYKDGSWILLLEFFSAREVEDDKTCIIAKGDKSAMGNATDIFKKSEWIGPGDPALNNGSAQLPEKEEQNDRARGGKENYLNEA